MGSPCALVDLDRAVGCVGSPCALVDLDRAVGCALGQRRTCHEARLGALSRADLFWPANVCLSDLLLSTLCMQMVLDRSKTIMSGADLGLTATQGPGGAAGRFYADKQGATEENAPEIPRRMDMLRLPPKATTDKKND